MSIALNAFIHSFIIDFLLCFSRIFTELIATMWTLYNGIRMSFSPFFYLTEKKTPLFYASFSE